MKVIVLMADLERGATKALPNLVEIKGLLPARLKTEALAYLEGGSCVFDVMEATRDPLDPSTAINGGPSLVSDGFWVWRYDLAHYVRHYNIALPAPFLETISRNAGKVPPLSPSFVAERGDDVLRAYQAGRTARSNV
jgi:hypothetical protein